MTRCVELAECGHEQERVSGRLSVSGSCTCAVQQRNSPNTPSHCSCFGAASLSAQSETVPFPTGKVACYFPISAAIFSAYFFTDFNHGNMFSMLRIWAEIFQDFQKKNPSLSSNLIKKSCCSVHIPFLITIIEEYYCP